MCLIICAINKHPAYKLILAANRDEYYDRPSAPADFWDDAPHLLAGRDLAAGGTWLGITKKGRLGAITNYRDPGSVKKNAPSRGKLLSTFLLGEESARDYLNKVQRDAPHYNGFNLIIGEKDQLFWYSNRSDPPLPLSSGLHGLSNHLLDTPWPKVTRGKDHMSRLLPKLKRHGPDELFQLLEDRTIAPDESLPHTGVGLEWERILSPIFILSPTYGTRASTLLFIDKNDHVTFIERTFRAGSDRIQSSTFEFVLEQ